MRLLRLRTILVATDLDSSSQDALDSAYRLATLSGASLHVVHVVSPSAEADTDPGRHRRTADDLRATLRQAHVSLPDERQHVIPGLAATEIGALADRVSADVIVLGRHRRRDHAAGDGALGSTARRVAERAFAPCLIAASALRLPLARVLVPTDFSETARGALLVGLSWASGLRSPAARGGATTLTALHAESGPGDAGLHRAAAALDHELEFLRRDAGSWAGVTLIEHVEHVPPGADTAKLIERYAAEQRSDLVVIGTRGSGDVDGSRLGALSEEVVMRSRVPTLLVPPAVWRTHAGRP